MGHEFVGIVEESPNPELIGKYVVGEINENCGNCLYCKTNRPTHCINRKVLGIQNKNGCFSEYITLNTNLLHVLPDNLSPYKAIYTEPFAAAFEILTQIEIKENTNIAILGDGRLAYCIAQAFHSINKEVTVIGKHDNKLNLFNKIPTVTTTKQSTNDSFEIVIEATGSPSGITQAINIVRKKEVIQIKKTGVQGEQIINRGYIDYIYSMDNQEDFGDYFYKLSFSEAIKKELLTDYKVLTLMLNEAQIEKILIILKKCQ